VVTEGTAKNAQVYGFSIGGKTGTSEKIDVLDENGKPTLDKIVSFVGVAPMDDPQYIVLVALDTPSRQTGMYISGGVMAAPTVGAVMADILPYLGVEKTPEASQTRITEDFRGMTREEAEKRLKELGITARLEGQLETVTSQIPAAGTEVPQDSQMILYFGKSSEPSSVQVPDFIGMNRQQAGDLAASLGLFLEITGNTGLEPTVLVTAQSVAKDTTVPIGTSIGLEFTDTQARD
jgi:stage V sporulation protein D (sporulation-specific penicillin-binding protein)